MITVLRGSVAAGAVGAALLLAACSSSGHTGPSTPATPTVAGVATRHPATSQPATQQPVNQPATQQPGTPQPTTPQPTGTPAPAGFTNLTVTPAVREQLVDAYVAFKGYKRAWIAGTAPGTVYYVYDPTAREYLAWAGFVPAAGAPERVLVSLQDDGARIAFQRTANQGWTNYDICTTPRFFAFVGGRTGGGGTC